MFYVYILASLARERFYIGYSEDPDQRLVEHNVVKVKSTRPYRPWERVHLECYATETEARRRERYLKRMKNRDHIKKLIELNDYNW